MIEYVRGESMNLIKVTPRGYCKGVVQAIQLAKQARIDYPNDKITVLGMLVHNQQVVDALKLLNIETLEDKKKTRLELIDQIDEGVVIFTAHGVSDQVKLKAKLKGLIPIDASCSDVIATADLIKEQIAKGYHVAYIGKHHHPEAEAILAIDSNIHLISKLHDPQIYKLSEPLFVSNQTTMSLSDVEDIMEEIKSLYPKAIFAPEICNATRVRQGALMKLKQVDCLIVAGDSNSNNTNQLAAIARANGIPNVYLLETIDQLKAISKDSFQNVAITSGASTPTYLTNQMIAYLEDREIDEPFDLNKILK